MTNARSRSSGRALPCTRHDPGEDAMADIEEPVLVVLLVVGSSMK
jgi:hypothetical protein